MIKINGLISLHGVKKKKDYVYIIKQRGNLFATLFAFDFNMAYLYERKVIM